MVTIKFNKTVPTAVIPSKRREDAGYDLYTAYNENILIEKGKPKVINTGIRCIIPEGFYLQVETRSSLASRGIFCTGGIIDNGYRGEIRVILNSQTDEIIPAGKAIAQMILHKCEDSNVIEIDDKEFELAGTTERGANGFGSTDRTWDLPTM